MLLASSIILSIGLFGCQQENQNGSQEGNEIKNEETVKEVPEPADVRQVVWNQMSEEDKEHVDGNWRDGTVSKVQLNESMMHLIKDKTHIGKEVYLIELPTKNISFPNSMIVYADIPTYEYIGKGIVD